MPSTIRLKPRYYRLYPPEGKATKEANYSFAHLDWEVPLSETALVLLDVWNYHFSEETWERIRRICDDRIVPLVKSCRLHGLPVIHTPANTVVEKYPKHRPKFSESPERPPEYCSDWPPGEFRRKEGAYAKYARPFEPGDKERSEHRTERRDIYEPVKPLENEPVILDGEELHLYCRDHGILHLLYAGFNTNACLIYRNYGTMAMQARGYSILVVRDCTTGMETHETLYHLELTRSTITTLEMFGCYSVTSEEIVAGLDLN